MALRFYQEDFKAFTFGTTYDPLVQFHNLLSWLKIKKLFEMVYELKKVKYINGYKFKTD